MIEAKNEKEGLKDPELVEDEVDDLGDDVNVTLPDYDGSKFELPEDFEYVLEGDEDGV